MRPYLLKFKLIVKRVSFVDFPKQSYSLAQLRMFVAIGFAHQCSFNMKS